MYESTKYEEEMIMKKCVLMLLAGLLALGLTACGESFDHRRTSRRLDDEKSENTAVVTDVAEQSDVDGAVLDYEQWVNTLPDTVRNEMDEEWLRELHRQAVRQAQQAHDTAVQQHNQAHNDAIQAHNQAHNDAIMLQQQLMMPMM